MSNNQKYNILIFPAGSEIAFEINNALKYVKFVNIIGGSSVIDHSEMVYLDYCSNFPYINDDNFIPFLNELIKNKNIDYIYPAMDMVQVFLTNNQEKINAKVITSPKNTVNICRSKKSTYDLLQNEFFVPKTYASIDDVKNFPVFVKPSRGQGSQGAKKIYSKKEYEFVNSENEEYVICEYLSGKEYTVDCFTDKTGKLRYQNIRSRDRIRTGISVRSTKCVVTEDVKKIAEIINNYFEFNGAWFFQLKENDKKELKLMEISPRIPGTMGLSRNLGVNFPLLTLYNMLGYDVNIICNDYNITLDRAFINRYKLDINYENVYIDFDDTVINKNKVNLIVIRYLYQLLNDGKNIYLLTRHKFDILGSLKKYKISRDIFKEIIVIDNDISKSKYITKKNAIFIDDSFRERLDVKEKLNIPVFDVDMIESLINWKE